MHEAGRQLVPPRPWRPGRPRRVSSRSGCGRSRRGCSHPAASRSRCAAPARQEGGLAQLVLLPGHVGADVRPALGAAGVVAAHRPGRPAASAAARVRGSGSKVGCMPARDAAEAGVFRHQGRLHALAQAREAVQVPGSEAGVGAEPQADAMQADRIVLAGGVQHRRLAPPSAKKFSAWTSRKPSAGRRSSSSA